MCFNENNNFKSVERNRFFKAIALVSKYRRMRLNANKGFINVFIAYFHTVLTADEVLYLHLRFVILSDDCYVSLIHGMAYNPLTGRWSWTQNQTINYALKAVKK